jgi:hypothetical protein
MTDLAAFFIGYALGPFVAPLLAIVGIAGLLFLLVLMLYLMLYERIPDRAPVPKPHNWTPAPPPSLAVPILVLLAIVVMPIIVVALRAG